MINTKKDRKNLYLRLDKLNLINKLEPILKRGGGYHCRLEDGRFVPSFPAVAQDAPWVYVQSDISTRCDVYHRVFFNVLQMIPSRCRRCFKVVVMPRNLIELFDLYELEREMGVPCKCGIEKRLTDTRLYGGYFYCDGLKEGEERYKEVRELVSERLSPETNVILKRYCTEYEIGPMGQGPSNELPDMTEEEIWLEEYVLSLFPSIGFGSKQPDWIVANVMQNWIHWAYQHGDPTYKEFTGDSPLFKPVVTYHNKEG